jgi:hypothetical protein
MRPIALALCVLLAGCGAGLKPGAESVRVVASEAALQGAVFVDSYSGWHGAYVGEDVETEARNWAHDLGADLVLIRRQGSRTVHYTVEAWRSRPLSPEP